MPEFEVAEAGIAELRAAMADGRVTSEGLVEAYLRRIEAYDRNGPALNAVIVINPDAMAQARASDQRRSRGELLGPLDGIPYTAKDSYLVKGLTAAAGSHAFENLIAQRDAFAIERLRGGGAVLIGLTNMPAMANGGMQRGLYGRAESPYNGAFLTAAFGSGSSNGPAGPEMTRSLLWQRRQNSRSSSCRWPQTWQSWAMSGSCETVPSSPSSASACSRRRVSRARPWLPSPT